jgi:hypothetical protein
MNNDTSSDSAQLIPREFEEGLADYTVGNVVDLDIALDEPPLEQGNT